MFVFLLTIKRIKSFGAICFHCSSFRWSSSRSNKQISEHMQPCSILWFQQIYVYTSIDIDIIVQNKKKKKKRRKKARKGKIRETRTHEYKANWNVETSFLLIWKEPGRLSILVVEKFHVFLVVHRSWHGFVTCFTHFGQEVLQGWHGTDDGRRPKAMGNQREMGQMSLNWHIQDRGQATVRSQWWTILSQ